MQDVRKKMDSYTANLEELSLEKSTVTEELAQRATDPESLPMQ